MEVKIMRKAFISLLLVGALAVIPATASAMDFSIMGYELKSQNELMFTHYDGSPSLLNEVNYENYTFFGISGIDLYLHFDGFFNIDRSDELDFSNPRSVFSTSNMGDWGTTIGVGHKFGPVMTEVFQTYTDETTGEAPTNFAFGFKW
jgi:hypothetical protein